MQALTVILEKVLTTIDDYNVNYFNWVYSHCSLLKMGRSLNWDSRAFSNLQKNHLIGTLTLIGTLVFWNLWENSLNWNTHFAWVWSFWPFPIALQFLIIQPHRPQTIRIRFLLWNNISSVLTRQWTNKQSHSISILSIFVGFYASDKSDGYVVPKVF